MNRRARKVYKALVNYLEDQLESMLRNLSPEEQITFLKQRIPLEDKFLDTVVEFLESHPDKYRYEYFRAYLNKRRLKFPKEFLVAYDRAYRLKNEYFLEEVI
ncbi:hypothetical protein H17ap60334_04852 [Thermosipho africanus H17ap60334]|uniref:hypothetical protein n=1 Tax=Thermosipho africanus TaxID=2421 RepID=UPI00028D8758|nr:hypothetical protein [Thermosipho africanus]EKF49512.1 hypothetical protein H17ap60334_04852 [Thermosipho africanus H17ap60334]